MDVRECRAPILGPDPATRREWKRSMYEAQSGRCWYCNVAMDFYNLTPARTTTPPNFATFEHVTPVRRRLRDENGRGIGFHPDTPDYVLSRENLVLACFWCNAHRGSQTITRFIARLRDSGKCLGIVARIRHLVDDHRPAPWQASEFEWYMLQALAHPRRPGDSLKRLPASLESAVLPDPSQPAPLLPVHARPTAAKRRAPPLVVRFFRILWRGTQRLRRVLHRTEAACR